MVGSLKNFLSRSLKNFSSLTSNKYQIFTLYGASWNNAYAYYYLPQGTNWLSNPAPAPAPVALDVDNNMLDIKITGWGTKRLEVKNVSGLNRNISNLKVKVFHS